MNPRRPHIDYNFMSITSIAKLTQSFYAQCSNIFFLCCSFVLLVFVCFLCLFIWFNTYTTIDGIRLEWHMNKERRADDTKQDGCKLSVKSKEDFG